MEETTIMKNDKDIITKMGRDEACWMNKLAERMKELSSLYCVPGIEINLCPAWIQSFTHK